MSSPHPCHHTLPTGRRCGSPALRNEQFCFYHHPTRRPPTRITSSRIGFYVPAISDAENLQIALSEVIRRVADNTLDTKRAGIILQTLQMAKSNLGAWPTGFDEEPTCAALSRTARSAASRTAPGAPSPDFPDLSALLATLSPHPTPPVPGL
jgi:hypothetical protein